MALNIQIKKKNGNNWDEIDPKTKAANVGITPTSYTPSGVTNAQGVVDNLKSMAFADVAVTIETVGSDRVVTFN